MHVSKIHNPHLLLDLILIFTIKDFSRTLDTSVSPDTADHHQKYNTDQWIDDTNMIILHLLFR